MGLGGTNLNMKENWEAIKEGWCPNCEQGKPTPMVDECEDCKSNPKESRWTIKDEGKGLAWVRREDWKPIIGHSE